MTGQQPDDEDDAGRGRRNIIVLGVVVAIVVIGWLVMHEMVRLTKIQDCEFAGHHNCETPDNP